MSRWELTFGPRSSGRVTVPRFDGREEGGEGRMIDSIERAASGRSLAPRIVKLGVTSAGGTATRWTR